MTLSSGDIVTIRLHSDAKSWIHYIPEMETYDRDQAEVVKVDHKDNTALLHLPQKHLHVTTLWFKCEWLIPIEQTETQEDLNDDLFW